MELLPLQLLRIRLLAAGKKAIIVESGEGLSRIDDAAAIPPVCA